MPISTTFFGIVVRLYVDGLPSPHIHGQKALIAFDDGRVMQGALPGCALALMRQGRLDHHAELARNRANA